MERERLGKIILLLVSICMFLLFSEIVARAFGIPKEYENENIERRAIYKPTNNSLIYEKAGVCIYSEYVDKEIVHCDYYNSTYDEFEINKSKDTFRIAVLGDSFSAGYGVGADETFPSYLDGILNNNSGIYNFQVYNFGIPGYNTLQELIVLKEKAIKYNPDLVILQYFDNDFYEGSSSFFRKVFEFKNGSHHPFIVDAETGFIFYDKDVIPVSIPLPFEVNKFLIKNSYFYRFLSKSFYISINRLSGKEQKEIVIGMEKSFDCLREMKEITEKGNISFIVIELPGVSVFDNCLGSFHETIGDFTNELKIPYVDLCDYEEFRLPNSLGIRNQREGNCEYNDCHYNSEGYRRVAEVVYENLKTYGMIPS